MGTKKGNSHQVQNGSNTGQTSPGKINKAKQKGKGKEKSWKRRVWTKLEASLWVIGAAFFLYRGDGIYNLPDVIRLDDNVDRCAPHLYIEMLDVQCGVATWLGNCPAMLLLSCKSCMRVAHSDTWRGDELSWRGAAFYADRSLVLG